MEFDEHEDPDEGIPGIQVEATYEVALGRASGGGEAAARKGGGGTHRYRECLKNHAVSIGGHALDGCGEFMAAGEDGTLDALKCAACNCHRNFHRKEAEGEGFHHHHHHHHPHHHQQFSPPQYYRTAHPAGYLQVTPPPHQRPLALPSTSREEEDMSNPSSSGGGGGGGGGSRKRFRTKFTQEQKDKMLELAKRLGWRLQKQDDAAVQQFCEETGVKRQVFKVWMHNNKHTLGFCRHTWSANHLYCRPTKHLRPRAISMVDDQFPIAGGVPPWPVTFQNLQGVMLKHPWDLCKSQRCRAV